MVKRAYDRRDASYSCYRIGYGIDMNIQTVPYRSTFLWCFCGYQFEWIVIARNISLGYLKYSYSYSKSYLGYFVYFNNELNRLRVDLFVSLFSDSRAWAIASKW